MTSVLPLDAGRLRRLRDVFRKTIGRGKHPPPVVWFIPDNAGCTIAILATPDVTLTCPLPTFHLDRPACVLWPIFAKAKGPLPLEAGGGTAPTIPELPQDWVENDTKLLTALSEADEIAASTGTRYALHRIQLRGKHGQVIATDSKLALIWSGFSLPFESDILVSRSNVFATAEFRAAKSVTVGRTATHLVVRAGEWTAFLAIDTAGRFPDVSSIVPKPGAARTRLWLDPAEAEVLTRVLPKLPGRTDDSAPVTLELGSRVVVRARGEGNERATVVPLPASQAVGPPLCLAFDRRHLTQVCRLGGREIELTAADKPAAARNGAVTLVFMPLPGGGIAGSPTDIHTTLAAIAGKPVKPTRRPSIATPVRPPSPVPAPAASPPIPVAPSRSRAGILDTLVAGSSWLLSTIRLKSIGRAS